MTSASKGTTYLSEITCQRLYTVNNQNDMTDLGYRDHLPTGRYMMHSTVEIYREMSVINSTSSHWDTREKSSILAALRDDVEDLHRAERLLR